MIQPRWPWRAGRRRQPLRCHDHCAGAPLLTVPCHVPMTALAGPGDATGRQGIRGAIRPRPDHNGFKASIGFIYRRQRNGDPGPEKVRACRTRTCSPRAKPGPHARHLILRMAMPTAQLHRRGEERPEHRRQGVGPGRGPLPPSTAARAASADAKPARSRARGGTTLVTASLI